MKRKLLLLFFAFIFISLAQAQSDASIVLNTLGGALQTNSNSGYDRSFLATTPGGENLVASNIKVGTTFYINIKQIHADGSLSNLTNFESSFPIRGLTCAASGNFSCFYGRPTDGYFLSKFTATGTPVWTKSMILPSGGAITEYYKNTINETASGEYYISVSTYDFLGIIKLDASGDLLWTKKLIGPTTTEKSPGFCTAITPGGGCVSTLKDENYLCVVNLAPDGTVIWSRSYVDHGSYRWPRCIRADNLGNFYVLGTLGGYTDAFISKIDSNGNFVYAKRLFSSGLPSAKYIDSYLSTTNELYILAKKPQTVITKVAINGNILWSKTIGGTVSSGDFNYTSSFSSTPSENISFLSFAADSTDLVTKFSGDPAQLCNGITRAYETIYNDGGILGAEIDSMIYISALPFSISGATITTAVGENYNSENHCPLLTETNGLTDSPGLGIYPNPATANLNIDLSKLTSKEMVLIVYDMTGRKVFEKQLGASAMETISTTEYAAGLYTVMIKNTTEVLAKQRVIVQK